LTVKFLHRKECVMSKDLLTPSPAILAFITMAREAGQAIMAVHASAFEARVKADASPVTDADEQAERIITSQLKALWPEIPVVAEEAAAAGQCGAVDASFFLVDPLDGTKEFLSRNGEFTVNIARIENGVPVQGVVFAPAVDRLWWGEIGLGAAVGGGTSESWQKISVRSLPPDGAVVVASRSHRDAATDAYLQNVKVQSIASRGSSLKFCLVAEGAADLYPRFGRTMEWDTAAGHAVVAAAGGKVTRVDGAPMIYGKWQRGFENDGFIASA
jgi:3'(2'), 5'-bisphosphate nucleotidase